VKLILGGSKKTVIKAADNYQAGAHTVIAPLASLASLVSVASLASLDSPASLASLASDHDDAYDSTSMVGSVSHTRPHATRWEETGQSTQQFTFHALFLSPCSAPLFSFVNLPSPPHSCLCHDDWCVTLGSKIFRLKKQKNRTRFFKNKFSSKF
jgi:hypothetical protein